ncbi:CBS domain-containing protein [Mammaliicoccus sp. R-M62]|uniref:CBS domain-containing protein n=1 Tax=Mammaliicoccus sp. R-M62 TaxID=2898721 RepID=UPI001EFBEA95|nr:CBS domain-containing protein [Mammaliicoccus sp. R-M62]
MKNSRDFINSFNKIENTLKELTGNTTSDAKNIPFTSMIQKAKRSNAVIRRFESDLREFAELRNAIVHDSRGHDHAIAEPHLSTVEEIKVLAEKVTEPKKVFPEFQSKVEAFQVDDTLSSVLKRVRENHYSQFPIFKKDEFYGLLSENGITNWLAGVAGEDIISIEETSIAEIFKHQEEHDNYIFVSRDTSIYQVEEEFKKCLEVGRRLDAVLINQKGKRDGGALLGIITSADILNIT